MKAAIIVHGGAGAWYLDSERIATAVNACQEAALAGQQLLLAGGSALAAAEKAVNILEDCPVLDAGRGSYPNRDGDIEMDALIMDGRTLESGAVAAVRNICNPISLAHKVMTATEHAFLAGLGAEAFADSIGFPRCTHEDLYWPVSLDTPTAVAGPLGDTVGAVAIDQQGNLATATSTGGTRNKMPGRIGDSPLIGSGGYADNRTAAVSATGQGEALMKILISKQVCDFVAAGLSAQTACEMAVRLLAERTGGEGGLIAIDYQGRIGFARNTKAMPFAFAQGNDALVYGR